MTKNTRAHLALVVVALIYGANYTIAREVMNGYLEPLGFIVLRAASAMLVFWGISFFQPAERIERSDIGRIILCGFFGVAANQMLFFSGLQLTKPINASSYGIYLVLVKSMMKRYQPITILKWIFTIGFFMVLPFGVGQLQGVPWENFPMQIWGAIAYVLIMVSCLSYLLNAFALKNVRASVVGIYIFLQPIMATIVALLAGRDTLSMAKIFAAVLIFCGVYLVSRVPKG